MLRRLLPLLWLPLASCVTQGTFDALKAEHDTDRAELGSRGKALEACQASLQESRLNLEASNALIEKAKARTAEQDRQLTELANRSATQGTRVASLEGELATMLKDRSTLQASVKDMTRALADAQKRKAEADARLSEFRALLDKFKTLIDAGRLKVRIVEGRMVVVLATDVLFGSGSANLSKEGKAGVAEVAQLLSTIEGRKFQVEGHTDNVPIATAQYPSNWELAAARALTVLKTMVEAGLPTDRISAASYGDSRPAVANDSPEGKGQNRRIEITLVPDLSTLPGFDELMRVEQGR